MTKEPNKSFKEAVRESIAHLFYKQEKKQLDATTDRILAICKEMLVPAEDNQGFGTATVSPSKTWNACRQHLLKQLGEK